MSGPTSTYALAAAEESSPWQQESRAEGMRAPVDTGARADNAARAHTQQREVLASEPQNRNGVRCQHVSIKLALIEGGGGFWLGSALGHAEPPSGLSGATPDLDTVKVSFHTGRNLVCSTASGDAQSRKRISAAIPCQLPSPTRLPV